MVLDDLSLVLQHASFLATVLAGFSVTVFVTQPTVSSRRRIVHYAAGAALVAGALLGIAAFTGVAGMVGAILDRESALGPGGQSTIYQAILWTGCSFLVGMVAFFASLALSGWIRSARFGIFATAVSMTTVLVVGHFLVAVMQAF